MREDRGERKKCRTALVTTIDEKEKKKNLDNGKGVKQVVSPPTPIFFGGNLSLQTIYDNIEPN